MRYRLDAAILCMAALLLIVPLVLSSYYQDLDDTDFLNGTFDGTRYNASGWLELSETGGNHTTNGTFISRVFNASIIAEWTNFSWEGNSSQGNITAQAAVSDNASNVTSFIGPDGTDGTWYLGEAALNISHGQYFRYRINLSTQNISASPKVFNVTIGYGIILPDVLLVSPAQGWTVNTSTVTFIYNVSSENAVAECALYIDGFLMSENQSAVGTENNITYAFANGNYSWTVGCSDTEGNEVNASERDLTVAAPDIMAPGITFSQGTPDGGSYVTSGNLTINISTDDSSRHSAFLDWNRMLLGWWSFENVSAQGMVNDASGNGRHGTMRNYSSNTSAEGFFGQGLTIEEGQGVNVLQDGNLSITPNTSFTAEIWFRATNRSAITYLLGTEIGCRGFHVVILPDGKLRQRLLTGSGCGEYAAYTITSPDVIADNWWHHVAAVYDRQEEEMKLFIDGGLAGTAAIDNINASPAGSLKMGTSWNYNDSINGTIDEVKVWKRALSSVEINASYDARTNRLERAFEGLGDGDHTAKAFAIDLQGNINQTTLWTFHLDAVSAPDIALIAPADTAGSANGTVQFSCAANDTNFDTELATVTFYWNASGTFEANGTETLTGESNTTTFSRTLPGDGSYIWNCFACDNASDCAFAASNRTLTLDTRSPAILSVQNGSPSNTSVLIAWTTDESANSSLRYGEDTSLLLGMNSSGSLTTSHSLSLTGLTGSTLYYYNLTSCDSLGNCNTTGPYNVTTAENPPPDLTAPTISNVSNQSTTQTSTSISWTTDELSNHTVRMGEDGTLNLTANSSASYSTSHSVTFQGLTNLTTYHYNITCCDPQGNCNTTGPYNVTTAYAPDTTDPSITLRSPADDASGLGNDVTFNCTASDYSLDNVSLYGNWTGQWLRNQTDASGANTDYIFFANLPNGTYQWACHACDSEGNCAFSANRTIGVGWAELEVVSTTPSNGTANASATMPIDVRFNSPIDGARIASAIRLLGPPGPFPFSASYDNATYTATLTPVTRLEHGTQYILNITTGLTGVYGAELAQDVKVYFMTSPADTDGDGDPDANETDDDDDGLNDTIDFLNGDASSVHSDAAVTVEVSGTANLSQAFTGTHIVRINGSGVTLVEFAFTFSNESRLDLGNVSIMRDEEEGRGSIVIRGISLSGTDTKTAWINDSDGIPGDVCVKDSDIISITELSDDCDGADERFIRCDGTNQAGYTCTATEGGLRVTGLSHSGAEELCREDWQCSTWIPLMCYLGRDQVRECNDVNQCGTTRYQPMVEQLCDNPFNTRSRGCRAEWECGEWEGCVDGVEKRTCVNVGKCRDHVLRPEMNRSCEEAAVPESPSGSGGTTVPPITGEVTTGGASSGGAPSDPSTEQPTHPIFEDEDPPEEVIREGETLWPYILFLFLGLAIIGGFIYKSYHKPYKSAGAMPVRRDRYLDAALKEREKLISSPPRPPVVAFSWPNLWKSIRRHRDLSKLRKVKKLRQTEFKEIRRIADEVKRSGDDSFVSRFMRYEIEDPSTLSPPERPEIHASGIADRTVLFLHGIKPTRSRQDQHLARPGREQRMEKLKEVRAETESGLMEKLEFIKKKIQEEEKRPGHLKERRGKTEAGLAHALETIKKSEVPEKIGKGRLTETLDLLKKNTSEGTLDESGQHKAENDTKREPLHVGSIMSKLRALNFPKRLGKGALEVENAALGFMRHSAERTAGLKEKTGFSVKKHRKDLAGLERTGLLARFVNDQEGKWNHEDWEALLLKVKNLGYDIKDYELGPVLEMEKRRYKIRKDLGR